MISQSTFRWMVVVGAALVVASCSAPRATTGADPGTGTNATTVNWSDGKPAYAISCDIPGGCQTRALAMCNNGSY
ncbi:MAG: hypothetical protein ACHQK9_20510, partial [Reyranellales bacterium]